MDDGNHKQERTTMRTKITKSTAVKKPHESCEVRERIFTYFRKHGAQGLREELLRGERTKAYSTFSSMKKYNIAIYFAKGGRFWTYLYSNDPDGNFDCRVLRQISRIPSNGATFEDCSNDKRYEKKSRTVLKIHRPFDWRMLKDKDIAMILEDYNWLIGQLATVSSPRRRIDHGKSPHDYANDFELMCYEKLIEGADVL